MEAKLVKFTKFLNQRDTRFVIPVYQRNYNWTETQCKQLYDDIFKAGSSEKILSHFIGSIVFIQDSVYSSTGVTELTIIDGQQRLTTLSLLLLAISQKIKQFGDEKAANKILRDYIINEDFEQEKLKLRPVKKDDFALKKLIEQETQLPEFSKVVENSHYFKNKILDEKQIEILKQGIDKLVFVEVSLERGKDDPQRIFESLNSTGLDLDQADLIRNYVLMDLPSDRQLKIYEKYWLPIEELTKESKSQQPKLSDFIRDYLSFKFREIPNKNKVFETFKEKYPLENAEMMENVLKDLKVYGSYYEKLINPEIEINKKISEKVKQINKLEINVSYPFLLEIYHDFDNQVIDLKTFEKILDLIQSFVWRRFICNLPTNALNKIFVRLYQEIDLNNYLKSLEIALVKKRGQQRFPKDEEVEAELRVKDFYNIQSKNRRYFLEQLENFNNNEPVMIEGNDKITIEHILPQNPSKEWTKQMDKTLLQNISDKYLHTIANLTLSGNNGELSNKTFSEKRDLPEKGYKDSKLFLNRYLATIGKWDEDAILTRLGLIKERVVKIWYFPDVEADNENSEINIFDIDTATNRNIDYVVFGNEKISNIIYYTELLQKIASELFDLAPNRFFSTSLADKLKLSNETSQISSPVQISQSYFIEGHGNANANLKRIRFMLQEFEMEDELFIKFK